MEFGSDYFDSQLEAIQKLYNRLSDKERENITVRDAIISWFSEGYAERSREEFLKKQSVAM